ncbi:MAG TPA: beta-ketoacyl synthase N-terminal-like domain-containing protein [Dehalococcoidales bacterium]|nr:beta-ketoacyl synthase N-terminal-like domain-containing protein [Dehalococcoidales bacterium]
MKRNQSNAPHRVVVTGLGAVSPVGLDIPTTWESLVSGKSGVGYISSFDTTDFETKIAAEVKGFDPVRYVSRKQAQRMDRFTQFGVAASFQAVAEAGLKITPDNALETGVIIGTSVGGLLSAYRQMLVMAAFSNIRALSTRNDDPPGACRPFDAARDGFVMGEGAAMMVLEEAGCALARGAPILAEITGYGNTSDAFHLTRPAPDGASAARAVRLALDRGGVSQDEVDYINAHGTATPLNDRMETNVIKSVFGDRAKSIPISASKSMIGHLIGAAGGIEAVITVLALHHGVLPPTINLTQPDPACDLDYVPNVARKVRILTAVSNAFGFGGHNSVLVFRKYR